jgi:hypothetical protein
VCCRIGLAATHWGSCCLLLLASGALAEVATGKPVLTDAELVASADVIVLGGISNIQPTKDSRIATARLTVYTWLKGTHDRQPLSIAIYSAGARDGLVSLWLLKRQSNGSLEETYPWVRWGPDKWLQLPKPLRDNLLRAVDHSASDVQDGLRLHLMRVPSTDRQPLQVWLVFENTLPRDLQILCNDPGSPGAVTFTVTFPDGSADAVPFLGEGDVQALKTISQTRFQTVNSGVPRLASRPSGAASMTTQLVLVKSANSGNYTIDATLSVPADRVKTDPTPPPEKAVCWSGRVSVEFHTVVADKWEDKREAKAL